MRQTSTNVSLINQSICVWNILGKTVGIVDGKECISAEMLLLFAEFAEKAAIPSRGISLITQINMSQFRIAEFD